MAILLNGTAREVPDDISVAELVLELGGREDGRGVAVAIAGEVVPRSAWASTRLGEGDRVEVLVAVQGG
ncbi:MAG TPA: sulfur carrier protein ThiS [Solirubrobacteraceae bacterium]|nr:sulfur carrier protein ThiS [Solirubrobacteraceae bacterium]